MDSKSAAEVLERANESVNKLKEVGFIKDGKLNLDFFNKNVKTVADNLGAIIPDIVEISKEQVALINHGLEGVMSFVRTFQITNTYVAVLFNNPDKLKAIDYSLSKVQDLEKRLLDDVKSTLTNLGEMLEETFRETAQYYSALAQIIYSEKEGGTIEIKYERSERLKNMMSKIYKRKRLSEGRRELKKSLGLVQIIKSLGDVNKELKEIKISDEVIKFYEIEAYKGEEKKKIKLDIDVLNSLKGLSDELISSLKRVGVLTQDQNGKLNVIKGAMFEQKLLTKYNKEKIEEALKGIKIDKGVIDKFKELAHIKLDLTQKLNKSISVDDRISIIEKLKSLKNEETSLETKHDEIIKREVEIIHKVITAFTKIVSLWGHMVDNELHIGQVAVKATNALEELTKLELKLDSDLDKEPILIAIETQKSIAKTCERAKELKTTGKVMNMLLKRLKYVVSFNDSLERYVNGFEKKIKEGEKYVYNRVKEANKAVVVGESKTKDMVVIMREFNEVLKEISNERNTFDTQRFVNELSSKYEEMTSHIIKLIKELKDKKSSDFKDIDALMKFVFGRFRDLLNDLNSFSKTFKDDFNKYEKVSKLYSKFIKNMAKFLDAIDYSLKVQEKLLKEEVSYKALNYRIKAFQSLFENLKKSQKEQMKLDSDLARVMKEVGMTRDYYSEYKKSLGDEFNELLDQMNKAIKDYFSDRELMKKQYQFLNHWLASYRVDFSKYNKELSEIKVGFFDRLFNKSKFKDFSESLSKMSKSLALYDHRLSNLSKLKGLKEPKDIGDFSDNVVLFVNEFVEEFLNILKEVYNVLGILNEMLSRINWLFEEGYIAKFQALISKMEQLNKNNQLANVKLEELSELKGLDMKRLRELFEGKPRVKDYKDMVSLLHKEYDEKVNKTESLKKRLKCSFLRFLINAYTELGGEEKDIKDYVRRYREKCKGIE